MIKRKTPTAPEAKRVKMTKGKAEASPLEGDVPTWEKAGWTRVTTAQHKDSGK